MNFVLSRSGLAAAALACLCLARPAAAADDPLFALQHEWWQWAGSIALDANPLIDETGKYCEAGQRGGYWFLAGNAGGRTNRACSVPKGVKLLVPVFVTFCYPEEGFDDDASCIAYVNDAVASYRRRDLTVKLDGVAQPTRDICEIAAAPGDIVKGAASHCVIRRRANRTLWNFVVNQSGFYLSEPGVWRANAARGVWAVIDTAGLAVGEHVVRIRAEGGPDSPIPLLAVTYRLTVAKAQN